MKVSKIISAACAVCLVLSVESQAGFLDGLQKAADALQQVKTKQTASATTSNNSESVQTEWTKTGNQWYAESEKVKPGKTAIYEEGVKNKDLKSCRILYHIRDKKEFQGSIKASDLAINECLMEHANAGNPLAQASMGWLNTYGKSGIVKNEALGLEWYKKAADQGHAVSQSQIGIAYETGNGAVKNIDIAIEWYKKAANQGNVYSQERLGSFYYNGTGVTKDYTVATQWYQKAAEQGSTEAQIKLGSMYYDGTGVTQDYATAAQWYQKAADHGDMGAQRTIGIMLDNGYGFAEDKANAATWYYKAAMQGDINAQIILGAMYYYGQGVQKDEKQAVYWWKKAAEQGSEDAKSKLAMVAGASQGRTDCASGIKAVESSISKHAKNCQDVQCCMKFMMEIQQLSNLQESGCNVKKIIETLTARNMRCLG